MVKRRYFHGADMWAVPAHQTPNVLNAFIASSLNHFLLADADITVSALSRYLNTVLCWAYPPVKAEDCVPFNEISMRAEERVTALRHAYMDANPEEVLKLDGPSGAHTQDFFDKLWKIVPETDHYRMVNGFFRQYYDEDDNDVGTQFGKSTRVITTFVLLGLLLTGLNDGAFASLCRNKDLDASVMTLEEKASEPLDPEALYSYLQAKLEGVYLPIEKSL